MKTLVEVRERMKHIQEALMQHNSQIQELAMEYLKLQGKEEILSELERHKEFHGVNHG